MLGEGEFKKVVMQGPWFVYAHGRYPLRDVDEIQEVAEGRMAACVAKLTSENLQLLDPYSLTRVADHDDPDADDIDDAVQEWCNEALFELMTSEQHQWVEEGSGLTYQWVTGGVTTSGNYPERAAEIIESLNIVGVFTDVITQNELAAARERLEERRSYRSPKKGSQQ